MNQRASRSRLQSVPPMSLPALVGASAGYCRAGLVHAKVMIISIVVAGTCALANVPATAAPAPLEAGEASFTRYCTYCHGHDATGEPDFFPSLLNAARAQSTEDFIYSILNGSANLSHGPGAHAIPLMPTWEHLDDRTLANIINYLFFRAGAKKIITTTDVAVVRTESIPMPVTPMSAPDFEQASELYFDKCAGCHGVNRQGAAGIPLLHWLMRDMGSARISDVMHYGTDWGMPGWGTTDKLSPKQIALLTQFLQNPAPSPPPFDLANVKQSWEVIVPLAERPKQRQLPVAAENLFVAVAHDTAKLILINGTTKSILGTVGVGLAPHSIDVSLDGRYLYVVHRDGYVALIDLFMAEPKVVARVRVGLDARSLAVSHTKKPARVVTGAYWPGQFSVLDALTLEPLQAAALGEHGARISQVTSLPNRVQFLLTASDSPELHRVNAAARRRSNNQQSFAMSSTLRGGSFDTSGRYFVMVSQEPEILVFDTKRNRLIETIETPSLIGGTVGVAYVDKDYGPVWASSSLHAPYIVVIGTDPKRHPDHAWQVVRKISLPAAGSLFITAHPNSDNLWVDLPISAMAGNSESAFVFAKSSTSHPVHRLPIARWAELDRQGTRVLHPQFNLFGNEVWLTVWNQRNQPSAIVVVDDETKKLKQVIKDERLVTITRTYSLGALLLQRRSLN